MAARELDVRFDVSALVPLDRDLCVMYRVFWPISKNNTDRITLCKVNEDPTGDKICAWVLAGETLQQGKLEEGKIVFSSSDLQRNFCDCSSEYYLAYWDKNEVVARSQPFRFYRKFEENLSMDPVSVSNGSSSLVALNIQRTMDKLLDQSEQLSKFLKDFIKIDDKCVDLERNICELENNLVQCVELIKQTSANLRANHKGNKPYEILLDYYAIMCDTITDVNDLTHYLVTSRVITPQDEKHLRYIKCTSLQVKTILDRIVGPVEAARPQVFYKLLDVLELSSLQATRQLATEIKQSLQKVMGSYNEGSDFKFRGDPQLMQLIKRLSDLKTKAKAKENIVEVNSQIAEIEENIKHLLEGTRFEALYDYVKRQDDELSFIKGDIFLCPTLAGDDGWMEGFIKRTGEQGLFPFNYVRKLF